MYKECLKASITKGYKEYFWNILQFGSWTYDGFKLDVDLYDGLEEIDVSDYVENNEFALIGHPAVKNVKYVCLQVK